MKAFGRALAWTGGLAFVGALAWFAYFYNAVLGRRFAPREDLATHLAIDLLLFALFGVHHTLFARERVKRVVTRWVPPAYERSLYVWVASGLFVFMCAAWQPVPGGTLYRLSGWTAWLGRGVQLLGVLVTAQTARRLDVLELAGIRQARGEVRPSRLEVVGPYRWVRHPIYLGWMLFVFGVPAMTADHLTFAITSVVYLLIGLRWEERSLVASIGEPYRSYMRRVRWRLVPYVY